jgi:hypothetical protein
MSMEYRLLCGLHKLIRRRTHTPACQACLRMHHRPAIKSDALIASPTPTTPPRKAVPRCTTSALASLFSDIYHDNPHFCTIYERGWTITITTDCKGCALETMTMPKKHCENTGNVTFRIPSTSIECATSTSAASSGVYPAGFKGPNMAVATPSWTEEEISVINEKCIFLFFFGMERKT